MSDPQLRVAAIVCDGFPRRVHTMLPVGHVQHARPPDMTREDVVVMSSTERDAHLNPRLVVRGMTLVLALTPRFSVKAGSSHSRMRQDI
jgi:hypothetical protein